MRILSELERVAIKLQDVSVPWALCGGVIASVYRSTPRFTVDIDIAILDSADKTAELIASDVLQVLGYHPAIGFVPDFQDKSKVQKALVCGRLENNEKFSGLDFLLPVFPWVEKGVRRAQDNLIDFGFAKLPALTVEDLLLAKMFALKNGDRAQDSDDIKAICAESIRIDGDYLLREAQRLKVEVPQVVLALLNTSRF